MMIVLVEIMVTFQSQERVNDNEQPQAALAEQLSSAGTASRSGSSFRSRRSHLGRLPAPLTGVCQLERNHRGGSRWLFRFS